MNDWELHKSGMSKVALDQKYGKNVTIEKTASTPADMSVVLSELEDTVSNLVSALSSLEENLVPIMRPSEPMPPGDHRDTQSTSALVLRLRNIAQGVAECHHNVNNMRRRSTL